MLPKQDLSKDPHGRQIIRHELIDKYIPEEVLSYLIASCEGYGLDWETIKPVCTLYLNGQNHCSMMYNVGQWIFSGKLLLTYSLKPVYKYRVSYPEKGRFLEHTLKNYSYGN